MSVDAGLAFTILFARWPGRRAPALDGRIWPAVAEEAARVSSPAAMACGLRARGLWEAAALVEDDALLEEAAEVVWRREARGWRPLPAAAADAPPRMRESLGSSCPALLWARGEVSALSSPLVAVVGSRELGAEESAFALSAGEEAARLGYGVVSGGARGSDRLGVQGAVQVGGFGAHVLPGGMPPRAPVASALLSRNPDGPEFDRLEALARNRWVYAAARAVVLVSSRLGAGGSWIGAISARRSKLSPLIAFIGREPSSGNAALARLGIRTVGKAEEIAAALAECAPEAAELAI